ncbi:MAG TPA: DNA ligase D [Terriglobales bacterium]|nr:DNA ligase D [Terriglobales bacterium]
MSLDQYRTKRKFDKTPEPQPGKPAIHPENRFYIQRHSARRLHYDLRLEVDNVLKSWALPKGPTLDPTDKRLAVHVEDHPIEYGTFQGTIPQGNYGAGTVSLWDYGRYELLGDAPIHQQLERGDLKFRLHGQKLAGEFALVRTKKSPKDWLLIKKNDFAVILGWDPESDIRSVLEVPTDPSAVTGAVKADMPSSLSPMLATLSPSLPEGPGWIFEPKWDGVRSLCYIRDGKVSLISRTGRTMDQQYTELADLPRHISASSAIIDGEIVALDDQGRPRFGLLQQRIGAGAAKSRKLAETSPVLLFAFDLLYLNGYDLRGATLIDRKALLKSVLSQSALVRYSDHFENGPELLHAARANELEGVVAKRATSRYEARRSTDWIKVKVVTQQEFVICGFTKGEREPFGALVLAYFQDGKFLFAGNVGTGFTQKSLDQLHSLLKPLIRKTSPISDMPKIPEKITWVEPKLVCTVKYMEWTKEKHLRAPVYLGLRDDVAPADCNFPSVETTKPEATDTAAPLLDGKRTEVSLTINGQTLKFTNLNKIYFPREGYTKRDVINYYHSVAPLILPYLKDRPLSLKRYPDGIEGEYFFQKNAALGTPSWMKSHLIDSEHRGSPIRFLFADDEASLLYLANLGCIDQNPWMSRVGSLDCPDFMLIDLDPVHCTFDRIVDAALLIKKLLDSLQLQGFPKTTGGDGLHIYVPLAPEYNYTQVRSFTEILARLAAAERPDLFTTPRTVSEREKGKVYFDYLQIAEGKTIAAPYVLRAFPGAPASTPLHWNELVPSLTPDKFTLATVPDRFARLGDIFSPVLVLKQKLEPALVKLESLLKK